MQSFQKLFFYCSVSILFLSCDNKLDLLDDYKETPIIYGLLNISDTIQYIRVQKAYLGAGNALLMAQNSDSIYYNKNDISVNLEESGNGITTRIISLVVDDTITKDDGLFAEYPHLVYRTDSLIKLNKDAQYKLVLNNSKTGKTISAITNIVGNLFAPNALATAVNIPLNDNLLINFTPVKNGKVYGLNIIFNYQEKELSSTGNFEHKSLDYSLPVIVNSNSNYSGLLTFAINGSDFYGFIESHIPINHNLSRPVDKTSLDFVFNMGAEDFYIYYSINQPSTTVNQSIPEFTNLSDGKGVFSSRNHNVFPNIKLNGSSQDILRSSERFE